MRQARFPKLKIANGGTSHHSMRTIDTYLTRLTLAGHRPTTIKIRRKTLTAFAKTVPSLSHATRDQLEAFLARPLSPASRRAYAGTFRSFYRYLRDEGLREDDPTEKLPRFRVPAGVPRPVDDAELALALAQADRRMRCWILLMCLAGLRCMEVAGLTPRDLIHTERGYLLHLREQKGGGSGVVPAHPAIVEALSALPIRSGTWWNVSPLTVSTQVGAYLRSLGVDATAHRLRHSFGTSAYRASGHDLLTTAALLRHASVATTAVYAKIDPDRPGDAVSRMPWPAA